VRRVYSRLRKVDTARLPDNLDSPALAATVGAPVSLSSIPPELLVAVCVAALLLALVQTARLAFTRWLPRHRIAVARAAGADGELRAEPLLRALGYAVVARQAPVSYEVAVDGEPFEIALRADFLLERDGRRYVAEVKTGRLAPRLETSATRRQLLEYRVAFDVDGVLLVDVDAGRVHSLEFPSHSPGGHLRGASDVDGVAATIGDRGYPRYDREAVGEESPVRPRGRQRGVPGTTARPSARSPRYDREAVSDQSQTLSVSEGESPTTVASRVRNLVDSGRTTASEKALGSVVGRSPSLTLRVWLWSLTASRSYRGLLADGLAVVPGTPR
jgi:hypothetical protein